MVSKFNGNFILKLEPFTKHSSQQTLAPPLITFKITLDLFKKIDGIEKKIPL